MLTDTSRIVLRHLPLEPILLLKEDKYWDFYLGSCGVKYALNQRNRHHLRCYSQDFFKR